MDQKIHSNKICTYLNADYQFTEQMKKLEFFLMIDIMHTYWHVNNISDDH